MPQTETNDNPVINAYDRRIILADGSEWSGTAGEEPETPSLWIWLESVYSMADVFQAFNDPEKTGTIKTVVDSKLDYDVFEETYENYTRLTSVNVTGNKIRVQLRKGGDSA